MTIKHILKDGTVLDDISGHVVKMEDAKQFYLILGRINEMGNEKMNGENLKCNS